MQYELCDPIYVEINVEDDTPATTSELINAISLLGHSSSEKKQEETPVMFTSKKQSKQDDKKKKKKNKTSFLSGAFGIDTEDDIEDARVLLENDTSSSVLLDVEAIFAERDSDKSDDIIDEQKKGYKKLKKQDNEYKKEFAEELTLLYSLLDETRKFSTDVEKKYKALDAQKIRGISKYTNDLAQIVLNAKQSKLSILKEITGLKKTIADLKIKADGKNKAGGENEKNPEYLASAYFKNILNHGRTDFIKRMAGDDDDDLGSYVDQIEKRKSMGMDGLVSIDDEIYSEKLEERLLREGGFRSADGDKYIKYENRGVKIYVRKCVDTGEWYFIAIDKYNEVVDDYPVPTKRDAGRMKFSDDGTYVTDERGRMYKVIEYFETDNDD